MKPVNTTYIVYLTAYMSVVMLAATGIGLMAESLFGGMTDAMSLFDKVCAAGLFALTGYGVAEACAPFATRFANTITPKVTAWLAR